MTERIETCLIWGNSYKAKPESTEGGRGVSVLKRQEGAPLNLR